MQTYANKPQQNQGASGIRKTASKPHDHTRQQDSDSALKHQINVVQHMADKSRQLKANSQQPIAQNNTGPSDSASRTSPSDGTSRTGLPDRLKAGVESLSGYSMDDVKVHYNSSKPAQLQAHAYAQGTDIHLGPGQEKHLPHESWHVVQQKQGRVQPTMQLKGGVNINDDTGLEKEADVMGAKAIHTQLSTNRTLHNSSNSGKQAVVQGKFIGHGHWMNGWSKEKLKDKLPSNLSNIWESLSQADDKLSIVSKDNKLDYNPMGSKMEHIGMGAIFIPEDFRNAIEMYVQNNQIGNQKLLERALSAFTHEMSHAYDDLINRSYKRKPNKENDEGVLNVLETELKAWKNEAIAALELSNLKNIILSNESKELIDGWLAVYYTLESEWDITEIKMGSNTVMKRMNTYFDKNKGTGQGASQSLKALLSKDKNLKKKIKNYAKKVCKKYKEFNKNINDNTLRTNLIRIKAMSGGKSNGFTKPLKKKNN
ncbi:MAG: DUF4157 domain-containing protein, partial [Bacteroidota bacterium]